MTIRLLQWNIWFKEKIENIVKEIQKHDPDIVCLQELTQGCTFNRMRDTSEYIARNLGFNHYFKVAQRWKTGNKKAQGNGIFTRFPIQKKFYDYVAKPEKYLNKPSSEKRIYSEITIDAGGAPLTVGTTHLSYEIRFVQTDKKKKEADNLINIIKNKKKKYVLAGDFNSGPVSYTIDKVQDYLLHAGPDVAEKTWPTKPHKDSSGWSVNSLDWRLDYVFVTGDMKVKSSKIIKTDYSDHLPILVELEI